MERYTVLGSTGFIGSNLVKFLRAKGGEVYAPSRIENLRGKELGTVFYCIGMTADFRKKPLETIDAHVNVLKSVLQETNVKRLIYLSSTRVYQNNENTNTDAALRVNPHKFDDIYNITKILGESICLSHSKLCKVVRVSNVLGLDPKKSNFLYSLIEQMKTRSKVVIQQSPEDAKDYVDIEDVCDLLYKIGTRGNKNIYNLASGINISNREIASLLVKKKPEGTVEFLADKKLIHFPVMDISSLQEEFTYRPMPFNLSFKSLWEEL